MFKVGDVVKGNENHINHVRMNDRGIVTSLGILQDEHGEEVEGVWVAWANELPGVTHFAYMTELTMVGATL